MDWAMWTWEHFHAGTAEPLGAKLRPVFSKWLILGSAILGCPALKEPYFLMVDGCSSLCENQTLWLHLVRYPILLVTFENLGFQDLFFVFYVALICLILRNWKVIVLRVLIWMEGPWVECTMSSWVSSYLFLKGIHYYTLSFICRELKWTVVRKKLSKGRRKLIGREGERRRIKRWKT